MCASTVHEVCLVCALVMHGEAQVGQSVKTTNPISITCQASLIKGKPKNWSSFKSKSTQKCHLSILTNTWHATLHYTTHVGNAWTHGNMPKYMIKMPQGAKTDTIKANGTQPNQNFEKNLPKIIIPNPFFKKSPIQEP